MGRRGSGWGEYRRADEQEFARTQRDIERARRDAERQAKAEAREQELLLHERGAAEASRLTVECEARTQALRTLLVGSLRQSWQIPFSALKWQVELSPFDPGSLGTPSPAPQWDEFVPQPGWFVRTFGSRARLEQAQASAEEDFRQAIAEHERAESDRQRRLVVARAEYDERSAAKAERVRVHNAAVEKLEAAFCAGDPDAIEDYVREVLARSPYPEGFPNQRRVAYRQQPRELWVEVELPGREVIPKERGYKYVKVRKQIDPLARSDKEIKQLYASLVGQLALRTLRECFDAPANGLIDTVVFNGHVTTHDPATGQRARPCLVSVSATRRSFEELVLDQLDPISCLKHLNALVSPHPFDLVAIPPVIDFDLAKYKFIDEFDAAAQLDSRSDLLQMDPFKFEHLIRQLFTAMGMKSWVTQASRDDGIDAVATQEDPILGGVCVIQAKRYKNVVPADAVRALWGAMDAKGATKGILVTTSWFGSSGRQFAAARNERIRLIEGPELKHLLSQYLSLNIRIGLSRQPPTR